MVTMYEGYTVNSFRPVSFFLYVYSYNRLPTCIKNTWLLNFTLSFYLDQYNSFIFFELLLLVLEVIETRKWKD